MATPSPFEIERKSETRLEYYEGVATASCASQPLLNASADPVHSRNNSLSRMDDKSSLSNHKEENVQLVKSSQALPQPEPKRQTYQTH